MVITYYKNSSSYYIIIIAIAGTFDTILDFSHIMSQEKPILRRAFPALLPVGCDCHTMQFDN